MIKANLKTFSILVSLTMLTSCITDNIKIELLKLDKTKLSPKNQSIKIIYTNSFNSNLKPIKSYIIPEAKVNFGGKELNQEYFQYFENIMPNALKIDGGQIISDSTSEDEFKQTLEFIKDLEYDAILLSDHELLNLKERSDEVKLPFVNSNIIELDSGSPIKSYGNTNLIIKEVNGLKVAIIGLTPYKDDLKKIDGLEGILFDDVVARVIQMKKKLKKVDLTIALLHGHNDCSDSIGTNYTKCEIDSNKLSKVVKRLPPNTIDIIFTGNSFKPLTNEYGYPIISNLGHGQFATIVDIPIKEKRADTSKMTAQQVRFCSHYFATSNDCYINPQDFTKIKTIRDSRIKLVPIDLNAD